MKKKTYLQGLLFLLMLCIAPLAKAQTQEKESTSKGDTEAKMIPLLAIGNKWNTIHKDYGAQRDGWLGILTYTRHYRIDREVELNGKKYFEILLEGKPKFYMREDLQTGKVYRYHNYDGSYNMGEQVVFDYNLKAGDTFFWYNRNDKKAPTYFKVLYVKEIDFQGSKRRAYKIKYYANKEEEKNITFDNLSEYEKTNPLTGDYWIEGIGSQQGIDDIYPFQMSGGEPEYIRCFTNKEGVTYNLGEKGEECEYEHFQRREKLAVEQPLSEKLQVRLLEGAIEFTMNDAGTHSLALYDMAGQLLGQKASFTDTITLPLPALNQGATLLIRVDQESMLYTIAK